MRKLTLLVLAVLAVALPLQAEDRHQSFISHDDGGTLVRTADDDREIEARVNLPIFPGDEVITDRRGRTEVRLADGNVLGIDRATAVRFSSILDSYEGEASETIIELRYGKVAVYRVDDNRDEIRIDTPSATYFASDESIFSVETDSRGRDRVAVFDGAIEVRTPSRSTRLRSGEQVEVDDRGEYDVANFSRYSADDFESWFLRRAERYGASSSRYLDRSLAYYDDELSRHGSWVHINSYGWAWRPTVSLGWRPYYNGYWHRGRAGCLTWVSYEPWGWVPYHYGRWSHDPFYGWFWVPGAGYAPAWVYWWYGPGYVGWAPSGWWDLHRPYYDWAYRPYSRAGLRFGFGFYGRVRVNDVDLRPWTFIDSNTIVSNRIDRAALTTDAIRARLSRDGGGFATISNDPARFTREEFRDPAAAINRRWKGVDTGRAGAGPAGQGDIVDVTSFIRRDPDVPNTIRDRVVRNRPSDDKSSGGRTIAGGGGGGGLAPIGGGSVAPVGGGSVAPVGRGGLAPVGGETDRSTDSGRDRVIRGGTRTPTPEPAPSRGSEGSGGSIDRGHGGSRTDGGAVKRGEGAAGRVRRGDDGSSSQLRNDGGVSDRNDNSSDAAPVWRDRVRSTVPRAAQPKAEQPATREPEAPTPTPRSDWRSRVATPRDRDTGDRTPTRTAAPSTDTRRDETPRRIIDRIGGARVQSGEKTRSSSSGERSRDSGSSRSVDRPSSSGSSAPRVKDSGGSRSSGGSRDSGGSRSSGGSRESGGRIKSKD
ncbi:MAG TPA: DUF6600 domain-containing protein [Thermoanaerobaculia bacterium]